MLADIMNTLIRPTRSVASPEGPNPWSGFLACVFAGIVYAGLCSALASLGLKPSSDKALLVPGQDFFGVAQYYGPIAFLFPAGVVTLVVWLVGRKFRNELSLQACWCRLSLAYGAPFLFCFALPDAIVFSLYGFDGLKVGLAAVGVATVYFVTSRTVLAIRQLLGTGLALSFGIAILAGVLQSPILMLLVR